MLGRRLSFLYNSLFFQELVVADYWFFPRSPNKTQTDSPGLSTQLGQVVSPCPLAWRWVGLTPGAILVPLTLVFEARPSPSPGGSAPFPIRKSHLLKSQLPFLIYLLVLAKYILQESSEKGCPEVNFWRLSSV